MSCAWPPFVKPENIAQAARVKCYFDYAMADKNYNGGEYISACLEGLYWTYSEQVFNDLLLKLNQLQNGETSFEETFQTLRSKALSLEGFGQFTEHDDELLRHDLEDLNEWNDTCDSEILNSVDYFHETNMCRSLKK